METDEQKPAVVKFCERVYIWVAYLHSVGEAEQLALLLMHKDNAVGAPHLNDMQRAVLEAAISRWPAELTLPLCEALAQGVLLNLNLQLPEGAAMLKSVGFCKKLLRQDRGTKIVVRVNDAALVTMHSLLANKSLVLQHLAPMIAEHDQHLAHLERMERRLERLERR